METIDVGLLSLVPPIIAIVLALCTKEVISSLIIGILSGGLIYALNTGGGIVEMSAISFGAMAETVGSPGKFNIILFLALLGALVCVVTKAGGSRAYGNWASTKIKNKKLAQLATSFLGVLIFIDDYFNCLTVGTVMKPVTDKYNVSRAKLAYIIDATAAQSVLLPPFPVGQLPWVRPFTKPGPSPTNCRHSLPPFLITCMPFCPSLWLLCYR